MRNFLLIVGLLLLFVAEILNIYLLMPFPGIQQFDTIGIAYFLSNNMTLVRVVGLVLIAYPAVFVFRRAPRWKKIRLSLFLLAYIVLAVFLNLSHTGGKHVLNVSNLHFATDSGNKLPSGELIVGVVINGRSKAYPVDVLGYHQQVNDTFGFVKVLITYSAESRSARVYSSFIDLLQKFVDLKIVGMNDFNTVMQDDSTKSWWQQETGDAVTGPLIGSSLKKLPSEQMTLASWLRKHPGSLVLQPDSAYIERISKMGRNEFIQPDPKSWEPRSLVVGVEYLETAKAYDWNQLLKEQIIQDSLPLYPVLLTVEKDKTSFHLYNRFVNGNPLRFKTAGSNDELIDLQTNSTWNADGLCIDGPLKGNTLTLLAAHQEFWRAWKHFHPKTGIYK